MRTTDTASIRPSILASCLVKPAPFKFHRKVQEMWSATAFSPFRQFLSQGENRPNTSMSSANFALNLSMGFAEKPFCHYTVTQR